MSAQLANVSSGSGVDEKALEKKAYEQANKHKNIKLAYIYRKEVTDNLIEEALDSVTEKQENYFHDFKARVSSFFMAHGKNVEAKSLQIIIKNEKKIARQLGLPVQKLISSMLNEIRHGVFEKSEINVRTINEVVDEIYQENQGRLHEGTVSETMIETYEKYFGQPYEYLGEGGMVYTLPDGKHKWSYNASWLLGHFHKGTDTFIIKSSIDDESMLRGKSSEKKGDMGSGFFREIAICYLYGFRVKTTSDMGVIMHKPYQKQYLPLQNVKLDEILNVTIEQMMPCYLRAMKQYNKEIENLNRIQMAREEAERVRGSLIGVSMFESEREERLESRTSNNLGPSNLGITNTRPSSE